MPFGRGKATREAQGRFSPLYLSTLSGARIPNTGCLLVLNIGAKVESSLIQYRHNKTISDIQPDSYMYRVGLDRIAKNSNADTINTRGGNMETHVMVNTVYCRSTHFVFFWHLTSNYSPWTLSRGGGRGQ